MAFDEAITILTGLNKPDGPSPPHLAQTYHDHLTGHIDRADDVIHETWNRVFDLAEQTPPDQHDGLTNFLVSLKGLEDKDESGQKKVYAVEGGQLWEDMPTFGWVARDRWNFDLLEPGTTPEEASRIDNMSAFLARLTSISTPDDPFDFSLYAVWALRTAFEEEFPPNVDSGPAVRNAAVWIKYSGSALWKAAVDNKQFEGRVAIPGSKFSDKGWKGFSDERWRVWKAGFEAAESISEAKDAAQEMTRLET